MKARFIILSLILMTGTAWAQHDNNVHNLQCGSHIEVDPDFVLTDTYKEANEKYLQQLQAYRLGKRASEPERIVFPMVVHIIHNNGNDDSISMERVQSMMPMLQAQMRQIPGTPFYSGGTYPDAYIEFELATIDPDGNPTTGVVYHNDPDLASEFNRDSLGQEAQLKEGYTWDKNKYMHVWVCSNVTSNAGNLGGYAQFPESAHVQSGMFGTPNPNRDGVVVRTRTWGNLSDDPSPWDATVVHELGHWIGLFHPFQNGCGTTPIGGNCLTTGDRVCDTPPATGRAGSNNVFASGFERLNSCVETTNDKPDLHYTYMDYTSPNDRQNMFTAGQVERARTFMTTVGEPRRYDMWQEANHQATGVGKWGPLVPNFRASHQRTYVGMPVSFKDYTRNIPTTYTWTFAGGTPATSTDPNPTVTWDAPGTYSVSLSVNNHLGEAKDTTFTNYITVTNTRESLPLTEDFTGTLPNLFANGWQIMNADSGKIMRGQAGPTWQRSGISGVESANGAMRMRCAGYADIGQQDAIVTPFIDVEELAEDDGLQIAFAYNYRPTVFRRNNPTDEQIRSHAVLYTDTLVVQASPDGGLSWHELWRKGGEQLATWSSINDVTDGSFIGESTATNNWSRDTTCAAFSARYDGTVQVRFLTINGNGASIFLDDISIFSSNELCLTSRNDARPQAFAHKLRMYPNPATTRARLEVDMAHTAQVQVDVMDVQGRTVQRIPAQRMAAGTQNIDLSLENLPQGLYLVRVAVNGQSKTLRLAKQ